MKKKSENDKNLHPIDKKKRIDEYSRSLRETQKKESKTTPLTLQTNSNMNEGNNITTNKMNTHSIKTNSNKGDFKTESSYQKRKNYKPPSPKLAKAKTEEVDDNSKIDIDEEENRAQTEKLKEEGINNLLSNAQRQCIENVKADIQKEQQGKVYQIVEKKLKTLETNGEVLNVENLTNKDEDEEETEERDEGIEEQQETDQQKENIETEQEFIKGEGQEIDNDDNSRLESRENKLTTMNNENTSKISIQASKINL